MSHLNSWEGSHWVHMNLGGTLLLWLAPTPAESTFRSHLEGILRPSEGLKMSLLVFGKNGSDALGEGLLRPGDNTLQTRPQGCGGGPGRCATGQHTFHLCNGHKLCWIWWALLLLQTMLIMHGGKRGRCILNSISLLGLPSTPNKGVDPGEAIAQF